MRALDEYRDRGAVESLLAKIRAAATRPWTLMEVCGGQTHTIVRYGLDRLLDGAVELLHGPGCPTSVTPFETIDRAHVIAARPDVILTAFGDMLGIAGSQGDLLALRAAGADVRVVYSPLDAVQVAIDHPDHQIVFVGIGFETTAPANAMAIYQAAARRVKNFSMLVSHVLVPPAIDATMSDPATRVEGFLAPGHLCAAIGTRDYEALIARYRVPIVVTGFEPVDLLEGVLMAIEQLEEGRSELANQYARSVERDGRQAAAALIDRVFEIDDRQHRGGWRIRDEFAAHDAAQRFAVEEIAACEAREYASERFDTALRAAAGHHAG